MTFRNEQNLKPVTPGRRFYEVQSLRLFLHNFCTFAYEKGGDIPMTPTPSSCFLVTRHHIHPATSRKREQGRSQATSNRRNGRPKYSVENGTTGSQVLRTPTHERVRLAWINPGSVKLSLKDMQLANAEANETRR